MSLLLEALKKAEKAKQEAQRAKGSTGDVPDAFSLAPNDEPRRIVTRDELPDISRPVEIQTADLGPAQTPPPIPSTRTGLMPLQGPNRRGRHRAATLHRCAPNRLPLPTNDQYPRPRCSRSEPR